MIKTKVVAMLLAGGQGSRLKLLTRNVAKPAVLFGGKYRIIDFALSNATNSGIGNIGVLTQYKPYELNTHIGIGTPWDFDRNNGGLRILQPFMSEDGGRWYTGTANAIYENIDYIDDIDPEYVLILSGDHIYKMDYNKMIKFHKERKAQVTIAVMEVPWDEASRFGILNLNDDGSIKEFDEKPEVPKNNLASMGIYVFNWKDLRHYLLTDNKDESSSHDFGKDVLPRMLEESCSMYAWRFDGYWKDVGTVRSYWEANMDLLNQDNQLNLHDGDWKIYTKNRNLPPQYLSSSGMVHNSLVNEGCIIEGTVINSVLFSGVHIKPGARVVDSVLLSNTVVKEGANISKAVLLEDVVVGSNQSIGDEGDLISLVAKDIITLE